MISTSSCTASPAPATSANVVFGVSLEINFALDFPNCMTREPPPCIWFIRNRKMTTIRMNGSNVKSSETKMLVFGLEMSYFSSILPAALFSCRRLAISAPWRSR